MKAQLFGADAGELREEVARHPSLRLVEEEPDVIICYGGDGTLLTAERRWPGVPKAPIRNSRRGHRCIAHPASDVIARLAAGELVRTEYLKIACTVRHTASAEALRSLDQSEPAFHLTAMNEINVHMGRINSAVRFLLWLDDEPFQGGQEILGDGLVVSTPFGSTAYFCHITRGVFHAGIGIAVQNTAEHVNHIVAPDSVRVRVVITRGPATLAYDNSSEYFAIREGHELVLCRHAEPAVLLTWSAMAHPSDEF